MTDRERFEKARERVVGKYRERQGIGTLQEKTVHAVLKDYYAPDAGMQEIPVEGCVADIYTGNEIIEIQTGNFDKLRGKLDRFLPVCPVTVVYPIAHVKWLIWIDEESGELSARRKSPLKGSAYLAFKELYKIKGYLKSGNLHLKLVLIDMEEYKILDGWSRDRKKGASRYDRIPLELVEEVCLDCPQDYMQLVPYELEEPFTVKEFAKHVHIRAQLGQVVLHILNELEIVERVGKRGRAYLYRVKE